MNEQDTDWTEENQVIKIVYALEAMHKAGGKLPMEEQDTHRIYEYMEGKVPERVIHLSIHHRIVFCADCGHVTGGNPEECSSCYDHRFGNSRFRMI